MVSIQNRVTSLPSTQQVALWVILRMSDAEKKEFKFFSREFAKKFKKYTTNEIKGEQAAYGRFIGGVLSGLYRNKFVKRLSGGRDKLWTLTDEVRIDLTEYQKQLFEVKTYWS